MKLEPEWRTELEGVSKHFKELADALTELHTFSNDALNAEELPDDWFEQYEQKLHWFMILFAAKFAEAPSASSETSGPRDEVREEDPGSDSQETEDETT